MKLGLGLYRDILTPENVRFAKQAGATQIVAHIPGRFTQAGQKILTAGGDAGFGLSDDDPIWSSEGLADLKAMINAEGMELAALENFAPVHWYDVLLDGPQRGRQIAHLKRILRDLGRLGISVMGYNFSIAGVWGRVEGPFARGGAKSVGYDDPAQTPIPLGMVWNMVYDTEVFDAQQPKGYLPPVSAEEMWQRYRAFLDEMIPVAEEAGVVLAIHPDDPPLPTLRGMARLVTQPDDFGRVLDLNPSPANALEFCVGTVAEMPGSDVYATVDRYSKAGRIAYVHFRNVRGKAPHYQEMMVDDGDVDMIEVMRILQRNGFAGVMIPDHTPLFECAAPWHAGMAYALGFMRAALKLIQ
jgi:mannonate dehydratase